MCSPAYRNAGSQQCVVKSSQNKLLQPDSVKLLCCIISNTHIYALMWDSGWIQKRRREKVEKRQVKQVQLVVGLRTRVASIRTLIFSSPHLYAGSLARSDRGRPLGGTSAWWPATVNGPATSSKGTHLPPRSAKRDCTCQILYFP